MVRMPSVNAKVFYFPQGHSEHASSTVDFGHCSRIPAYILCRVAAVKFMADTETDEVFVKIKLTPVNGNDPDFEDDGTGYIKGNETQEKPASFAKTLTQSDANNGGGFSVPRYCAETIFPRLDYSADPPVQTILAKDVHGETWKFRHIYRGIRRAKRGISGGPESSSGWNTTAANCMIPYGGFSPFLREDESKLMRNGSNNGVSSNGNLMGKKKVRPEHVIEAATLASNGQQLEVVYYPRASTPEFCVKASLVKASLQIRWCSGMRFKMAFETEDSSRISWFMGTISSVHVADPLRWPDSPWRLLQDSLFGNVYGDLFIFAYLVSHINIKAVMWDEPDLLQNVKRVSPWLVELVSNMPAIHLSPFSPPRKKLKLPQQSDFPADGQLPMPTFSGNFLGASNPFGCSHNTSPAGMQGARHAHYSLSLSDLHLNKLRSGLFPASFPSLDYAATPNRTSIGGPNVRKTSMSDNVSCVLTMSHPTQNSKKTDDAKTPQLVLFGQAILTEQQISLSCSADTISPVLTGNNSSEYLDKTANFSDGSGSAHHQQGLPERASCEGLHWHKDNRQEDELNLEIGHCKVFMESEDVGRTLDLSLLGSYDELQRKLADMFGIENHETSSHLLYRDATGAVKQIGEEPFSDFTKTARRLTILTDSSSDNVGEYRGRNKP
ncbi:Auxin response factor 10 [Hibiscus syriacus]|uniref:Auxin response factor n=1 Tax=Hibiscus syriacus TaxID=106335 RepID=A0A6A3BKV6_HIBSY|nr:Auxin response factor 10 [Hibiscus syriacus]